MERGNLMADDRVTRFLSTGMKLETRCISKDMAMVWNEDYSRYRNASE